MSAAILRFAQAFIVTVVLGVVPVCTLANEQITGSPLNLSGQPVIITSCNANQQDVNGTVNAQITASINFSNTVNQDATGVRVVFAFTDPFDTAVGNRVWIDTGTISANTTASQGFLPNVGFYNTAVSNATCYVTNIKFANGSVWTRPAI